MDVFTFSLSENNELIRTDNLPGINSGSKDYYSASVNGLISGTTSAVAYLTVSWHPGSKYGVPMAVSGTNGTFTIGEFFSAIPGVMNEYVDYHIGVSVVGYIGETRYTTNIVDIPIIKSNYSASTDAPSLTQNQYDAFVDEVSGYATAAASSETAAETAKAAAETAADNSSTAATNAASSAAAAASSAETAATAATNAAASAAAAADAHKMKLIRKITTTKDVKSVTINQDTNDLAFSLDKFVLMITAPIDLTPNNGTFNVYVPDASASSNRIYTPGNVIYNTKKLVVRSEIIGDGETAVFDTWASCSIFGSAPSGTTQHGDFVTGKPITSVTATYTSNTGFPAGTEIKLYGHRG